MKSIYSNVHEITLRDATKKYGDKLILSNVNFVFEKNANYILSGHSGIGKTTLLNIIAGFEKLDEGTVNINRTSIQYLFQDILLFRNLTVLENIIITNHHLNDYPDATKLRHIHDVLSSVGIEKSLIDKKVSDLSGGEQRRVQLAHVLISNPDIILLDEPTANLDYKNKVAIRNLINEKFPDKLRITVSHDLNIFDSDYISIELREGTIHYV